MNPEAHRCGVRWTRLAPLWIVALGLLAYVNSFSATPVFDDIRVFEKAARGWRVWLSDENPLRPVADASFMLNYRLSGTRTADYHAANLCIHLASALLLFGVARRTLCLTRWKPDVRAAAAQMGFATAALWVCHPLSTAAVTCVAQRYESLMGLFYLLTLYGFIRGATTDGGGRRWYGVAAAACLLGMGSKEVMVTAPVVVGIYDWILLSNGSLRRMLKQRWGAHLGLAAAWLLLLGLMLLKSRGSASMQYVARDISPWRYALVQSGAVAHYLRLAVWPVGLCFDYGPGAAADPRLGLVAAGLLAATACGVVRRRGWAFPGAWFFMILAPTSSVIPRPDAVVEHRMYLPLAAVTAGCAFAWHVLCGVSRGGKRGGGQGGRFACWALPALVLLSFVGLTLSRNRAYASEQSLWRSVTQARPENPRGWVGLGAALVGQGELDEAEACLQRALALTRAPDRERTIGFKTVRAMAHNNLGVLEWKRDRRGAAEAHFHEALKAAPGWPVAEDNLRRLLREKEQPRRSGAVRSLEQNITAPVNPQSCARWGWRCCSRDWNRCSGSRTLHRRGRPVSCCP